MLILDELMLLDTESDQTLEVNTSFHGVWQNRQVVIGYDLDAKPRFL